jgi:4'-phosphopantetheinyl transferase
MGSATRIETFHVLDPTKSTRVLTENTVHVWWLALHQASEAEVRNCTAVLHREELARAARFKVEGARAAFVLTRGTLRRLLAAYLRTDPQLLEFRTTQHGKPVSDQAPNLGFNVSHTDGLAVLAFARAREVGVDVERSKPGKDFLSLAERFFSSSERQALRLLVGDELQAAFYRCWARKEAYIKARGDGLSLPLDSFDVSLEPDPPRILLRTSPEAVDADRWSIRNLTAPDGLTHALPPGFDYAAALAFARGLPSGPPIGS